MAAALTVTGLFTADGRGFVSRPVGTLELTLDGIAGDRHAGPVRPAGPREPWHPRGTLIRNDRQLSLLGEEELAQIAGALGLDRLAPEWIGANLTLAGLAELSRLAPATRLMAPSGATVFVTGYNAPCRAAGRSVAARTGVAEHELGFVRAARGRRGLVGHVERAGTLALGDRLALVPPRAPR